MRTALRLLTKPPRGIPQLIASARTFTAAVGADGVVVATDAKEDRDRMTGVNLGQHFQVVKDALAGRAGYAVEQFPALEEGTEGSVWANRGTHDANPKSLLKTKIGPRETHLYKSDNHYRNFIDCVISRRETAAPVEVAHRSITICHLGNIAMRLGRENLRWDPRTEQIIGDRGLRKLLFNEVDVKQARIKQEIEDLKPVYINVVVESQMLRKRHTALKARAAELDKAAARSAER